jgi:hypothetical protein
MAPKKSKDPPDKGIDFTRQKSPYRTIKTSLKSILKNEELLEPLNNLILKCNTIVSDAYQFIRLFCLYKYHNKQPIPELTSLFIRYCIIALGTRDNRGRGVGNTDLLEELTTFYTSEFQPIYNHQKHILTGLNYVIPYLCETMETCIAVNLREHFTKRLLRFINIFASHYYDEKGYDESQKKDILWKLKKATLEQSEIPTSMKEWYDIHSQFLIPTNIDKSIPYDCVKSPYKYIASSLYMNQQYELYNELLKERIETATEDERKELQSKTLKLFQPLSLRSCSTPKYITIDTACLINLFAEKGKKGKQLQAVKEHQEEVWSQHFKLNKRIFRKQNSYSFNFTLQTDGVGCSLLFIRNEYKDKKYGSRIESIKENISYIDDISNEQIEILKSKNIVCADPGRKYLMYMMDGNDNKVKYSCMQRDTESLAKRNRRIVRTNRKNSKIDEIESELSDYCGKTVHYQQFKDYIKHKYNVSEKTKTFYEESLYRKLNWRKKVYRQKSEDKFLNTIETTFGDDCVICVGDWSNKNTIKGLAPSMGIGLKKLIQKRFPTLLLDEYNTSKKCHNCWNDVCNIAIEGKSKHRLLCCKSCGKSNTGSPEDEQKSAVLSPQFLTRDENSCRNMLNIVKHMLYKKKERPSVFCRNILPLLPEREGKDGR